MTPRWDRTRCRKVRESAYYAYSCPCHSDDLEPYDCAACGCGVEESAGEHTPGPWLLKRFDESQMVVLPERDTERHALIATVSIGEQRPDGEANARRTASRAGTCSGSYLSLATRPAVRSRRRPESSSKRRALRRRVVGPRLMMSETGGESNAMAVE